MKTSTLVPAFYISLLTLLICGTGCTQLEQESSTATESANEGWAVASDDFVTINEQALTKLTALDIDGWLDFLSDDVEYYFPDGDAGTRTSLIGKEAVANWWKNWKSSSGIKSMSATNPVFLPVEAKETLKYSGVSGIFVLSYFSNELVYETGSTSIRMNFATHFNADTLIDRYYTYYDRTPIIEIMQQNILAPDNEDNPE